MESENTKVVILTKNYRIEGEISLLPGVRLTDFMTEAHVFIAVTDASVSDLNGKLLLAGRFLNVHRDNIEVILPATLEIRE